MEKFESANRQLDFRIGYNLRLDIYLQGNIPKAIS